MEGTKAQKPTVSATRYPLDGGGRDPLGEMKGDEDQGFLDLWAVIRDHREGRVCTGVRVGVVPAVQSASYCGPEGPGLDARVGEPRLKP